MSWNNRYENYRNDETLYMVSVMVDTGGVAPQYIMQKNLSLEEAEDFAESVSEAASRGRWPKIYNTHVNPSRIITVRVTEERADVYTDKGRTRT